MGEGNRQSSTPVAPTLDLGQSKSLVAADYDLKELYGPRLIEAIGKASREEDARAMAFGLGILTDPSRVYQGQLQDARRRLETVQSWGSLPGPNNEYRAGFVWEPEKEKWISRKDYDNQVKLLSNRVDNVLAKDPIKELTSAFKDEFAMRDDLLGNMQAAADPTKAYRALQSGIRDQMGSTSEYRRLQDALGQGTDARTSAGTTLGSVADVQAGRADRVADISAGQVGAGVLGGSLMNEAMRRMELQGRLSAQDSRDVTQATRQGMAARGMATGNAALGAELLNRDRYTRQRALQDMAFAQGIQDQDLNRQQLNYNRMLEAAAANQRTGLGLSVADLNALMQARTANQDTAAKMSIAQGNLTQQNNQFNAGQLTANDRYNIGLLTTSAGLADEERRRRLGLLGSSAQLSDGERARQLAARGQAYNFALGTSPRIMLAGLGQPYANVTNTATPLLGGTNVQPMYTGGTFSQGGGSSGGWTGGLVAGGTGALSGALAMAPTGNPYLIAGGALLGGVTNAISGSR